MKAAEVKTKKMGEFEEWEISSAARTLTEAEEIKSDSKKMKYVLEYLKKDQKKSKKLIESIDDLRQLAKQDKQIENES